MGTQLAGFRKRVKQLKLASSGFKNAGGTKATQAKMAASKGKSPAQAASKTPKRASRGGRRGSAGGNSDGNPTVGDGGVARDAGSARRKPRRRSLDSSANGAVSSNAGTRPATAGHRRSQTAGSGNSHTNNGPAGANGESDSEDPAERDTAGAAGCAPPSAKNGRPGTAPGRGGKGKSAPGGSGGSPRKSSGGTGNGARKATPTHRRSST